MTDEELRRMQKAQEEAAAGTAAVAQEDLAEPTYTQSQDTAAYKAALDQLLAQKPADYSSSYADTIDRLLNQALNRETFRYDMNADPMYQQYKDQYTAQGKRAMRDTMGQAAQLTGGYGSSYASTAGSQAYQDALGKLNSVIPELYQSAASRYDSEGQRMLNNLSAANGLQSAEQSAYNQNASNYFNYLSAMGGLYNQQQSADFQAYQTALSQWQYQQDQEMARQQAAQEYQMWLTEQLAANTKKTQRGYSGMQMIMAQEALKQGEEAARAYIDQLKLDKAARANLLKDLGLNA